MAVLSTLKPPSPLYLLLEGRAFYELAASWLTMPLLRQAPRGDGHPVLVLPGFVASDLSTGPLRRYLRQLGYSTHPWKLGRNHGPRAGLEERMLARLHHLRRVYDRPVSLIGWSLGGVYARELAHRAPEAVRSIITLGSPFTQDSKANHSWRLFEWMSGLKIDEIDPARIERIRQTPPVPTTAIYTRSDGITAWQCCIQAAGPMSESIEVYGSHCGLGVNPLVLYAIADRLAQPKSGWRPFSPSGLQRYLYGGQAAGPV